MFAVLTVVFLAFSGALCLSLGMTPLMIKAANRLNVVDNPGRHKTHDRPVPYMGGIAMVFAVVAILAVWGLTATGSSLVAELALVGAVSVILAFLGLADDVKNLAPSTRLVVELAAALFISLWAARVDTALADPLDVGISVLWVVGVVNAVNMLDHQDGLAAGTTAISALTFAFISWHNNQDLVPALCGALSGASTGFLKSNFHPAKIYMGDSGAYFLGFLLAYAGLKMDTSLKQNLSFWIAPLIVVVPLLDSTLVVISRIRSGRNPLKGGKDHTSHRLMRSAASKRCAVVILYSIATTFAGLAVVSTVLVPARAHFVLMLGGLLFLLIWIVFWCLDPGYEDSSAK